MVKRKAKRTRRRSPKRTVRRRRNTSSGKLFTTKTLVAAGIYGAARGRLSAMILPQTNKLLGQMGPYADEFGMILGLMAIDKIAKPKGTVRDIMKSAIIVEIAQIGQQAGAGFAPSGTSSSGGY